MIEPERIEQLKMVQTVIARMAQNSFFLKGWSVTLVTAMNALSVSGGTSAYAGLALLPAVVFWGLDAYYLRQERLFRELDKAIRAGADHVPPLSLDTGCFQDDVPSWAQTLSSPTVVWLHLMVVAVAMAVMVHGFLG